MANDVFQCCYTHARRLTGDTANDGWETVAVSPDMPPEAVQSCRRFQNADCPDRSGISDERGNLLDLYETAGDGSWLFAIRTRYGKRDSLGRPSMFSHAYAFPLEGTTVLENPDLFLSLDKSCFKETEEEAAAWDGALARQEPLNLRTAMKTAGLDRERYGLLVRCIYAQMSAEKNPRPLYVFYDGSDRQLRALLYCIYAGLPFYMRKTLTTTSSANAVNLKKNLVFSKLARKKDPYLIPETGENTILIPRLDRKIARLGFVDHAATKLNPEEFRAWFQKMDEIALQYGDPSASSEAVLKLAYQFVIHEWKANSFSDEGIESNLSAALLCGTSTDSLETDMGCLLEEANRRNLRFPPELETLLEERLAVTENDRLGRAGLVYHTRKLYQPSVEEAANRLRSLPADAFLRYGEQLSGTRQGMEILECYFQSILDEKPPSWDLFSQIWTSCENLLHDAEMREKLGGELEAEAWKLYEKQAKPGPEAVEALDAYASLMERILPAWRYEDCLLSAKEAYWDQVKFYDFCFDVPEQYERYRMDNQRCRMFTAFARLPEAWDSGGEQGFLHKLFRFFRHNLWVPEAEKEQALRRLHEYLKERHGAAVPEDLPVWMEMAAEADTPDLLEGIQALCGAVRHFDAAKLNEAFPAFYESCTGNRQGARILSKALEALEAACVKNDTKEKPVALDLWLRMGDNRPGNCFRVFDKGGAAVLELEPAQVVADSELMRLDFYRKSAEQYVHNRGRRARAVKRWLSACAEADGNKARGLLGFLNRTEGK